MSVDTKTTQISEDIKKYKLEKYLLELETEGLTILPPDITGITAETIDRCIDVLLAKFTEVTGGCPITMEDGPKGKLSWPGRKPDAKSPEPTQMLITQLLMLDRQFRDLMVNPMVDALIDHMTGRAGGYKMRRLSSINCFVKWQGDFGYGPALGLHCDQGGSPLPWGRTALTSNATWCLTDYTKEDGALAWVPGSHKSNMHPIGQRATHHAVAAEAPRGSVIIWPGSTWHGAYPKQTKGLRLSVVAYYRHMSVQPQENLKVTMQDQPWKDCSDPQRMNEMIGFDDEFPYLDQSKHVPKLSHGN